jgi:hypothetical protein
VGSAITMTAITATTVSGTLFGVGKATGHPDIAITQGEFAVTRLN